MKNFTMLSEKNPTWFTLNMNNQYKNNSIDRIKPSILDNNKLTQLKNPYTKRVTFNLVPINILLGTFK